MSEFKVGDMVEIVDPPFYWRFPTLEGWRVVSVFLCPWFPGRIVLELLHDVIEDPVVINSRNVKHELGRVSDAGTYTQPPIENINDLGSPPIYGHIHTDFKYCNHDYVNMSADAYSPVRVCKHCDKEITI